MKGRAFFQKTSGGISLYLRATPNAGRDEITGLWRGANDETRLQVKIAAPPDKGRANEAVIKLLADKLGLPKSAISITAGETGRLKTVFLEERASLVDAVKALAGGVDDS